MDRAETGSASRAPAPRRGTHAASWRLLDTKPLSAAENVALDQALLTARARGLSPDTVRFLRYAPPAALVGFHQDVEREIRLDYCRANGIDVNRRLTGGGAIFFDESQLGWEVVCGKAFFDAGVASPRLFARICEPVVAALRSLGIDAEFRPRNDIEAGGRKISGTGGTEEGEAILFQGTLLMDFDVESMLKALRIPVEKLKAKERDEFKKRVTCVAWEKPGGVPLERVKAALAKGFEGAFGIRLVAGDLTSEEEALFRENKAKFADERWVRKVRSKPAAREVVDVLYRTRAGGSLRITLQADLLNRRIRSAIVTGDFFCSPPRAVLDLEASLKDFRLDFEEVRKRVAAFFAESKVSFLNAGLEDFESALAILFEKLDIARCGLTIPECNRIVPVNGTFEEIVRLRPDAMLLPYCAKDAACALRREVGCDECGKCTVGEAWTLARARGLETVCIVDYEHLAATLESLKKSGRRAFVGCCCEPFMAKHRSDFEAAGLPGLLVEIRDTTCYDLDRAADAYAGRFEGQTRLDLALLERVLNAKV